MNKYYRLKYIYCILLLLAGCSFADKELSISEVNRNKAKLFNEKGNIDSSIYYYNLVLKTQKKDTGYVNIHIELAKIHRKQGAFKEALTNLYLASEVSKKLKDNLLTAKTLMVSAHVYEDMGAYELALNYLQKSRDIYEQQDLNSVELIPVYNLLGIVHKSFKNTNRALIFHRKSLNLAIQHKKSKNIAASYNNIGEVYFGEKKYDSALVYFKLYKDYCIKSGKNLSNVYLSLGILEVYTGSSNNRHYIDSAFKYANKTKDTQALIKANLALLDLYVIQKEFDQAISIVNAMPSNFNLDKYPDLNLVFYKTQMQLYDKMGDSKLGFEAGKKVKFISDSLFLSKKDRLLAMELDYETEKGQAFYKKLNSANTEKDYLYVSLIGISAICVFIIVYIMRIQKKRKRELREINKFMEKELDQIKSQLLAESAPNPHSTSPPPIEVESRETVESEPLTENTDSNDIHGSYLLKRGYGEIQFLRILYIATNPSKKNGLTMHYLNLDSKVQSADIAQKSLKQMLNELPNLLFLRANDYVVLNLLYARPTPSTVEGYYDIVVKEKVLLQLELGPTFRKAFVKRYYQFMIDRGISPLEN